MSNTMPSAATYMAPLLLPLKPFSSVFVGRERERDGRVCKGMDMNKNTCRNNSRGGVLSSASWRRGTSAAIKINPFSQSSRALTLLCELLHVLALLNPGVQVVQVHLRELSCLPADVGDQAKQAQDGETKEGPVDRRPKSHTSYLGHSRSGNGGECLPPSLWSSVQIGGCLNAILHPCCNPASPSALFFVPVMGR